MSASALQRVAPACDLAKKKASITQSLMNLGIGGRAGSRLFDALRTGTEDGRNLSSHTIAKNCSFAEPEP